MDDQPAQDDTCARTVEMGVAVKELYLNGRALTNLGSLITNIRTRLFDRADGPRYADLFRITELRQLSCGLV